MEQLQIKEGSPSTGTMTQVRDGQEGKCTFPSLIKPLDIIVMAHVFQTCYVLLTQIVIIEVSFLLTACNWVTFFFHFVIKISVF